MRWGRNGLLGLKFDMYVVVRNSLVSAQHHLDEEFEDVVPRCLDVYNSVVGLETKIGEPGKISTFSILESSYTEWHDVQHIKKNINLFFGQKKVIEPQSYIWVLPFMTDYMGTIGKWGIPHFKKWYLFFKTRAYMKYFLLCHQYIILEYSFLQKLEFYILGGVLQMKIA